MNPHKSAAKAMASAKLSRMVGSHGGKAPSGENSVMEDYGTEAAGPSDSAKYKRGGAVMGAAPKARLDKPGRGKKPMMKFEGSKADEKMDKAGAAKAGMSMKKFEGSPADKKMDAEGEKSMPKRARGGCVTESPRPKDSDPNDASSYSKDNKFKRGGGMKKCADGGSVDKKDGSTPQTHGAAGDGSGDSDTTPKRAAGGRMKDDKPGKYKRGGAVKGKTVVNIVVGRDSPSAGPGAGAGLPPAPPMMIPHPMPAPGPSPIPMAPPGPMAGPPGGMPMPIGGGAGMPMRKRGGRVGKMTGGAMSGVGRLEKTAHAKNK